MRPLVVLYYRQSHVYSKLKSDTAYGVIANLEELLIRYYVHSVNKMSITGSNLQLNYRVVTVSKYIFVEKNLFTWVIVITKSMLSKSMLSSPRNFSKFSINSVVNSLSFLENLIFLFHLYSKYSDVCGSFFLSYRVLSIRK